MAGRKPIRPLVAILILFTLYYFYAILSQGRGGPDAREHTSKANKIGKAQDVEAPVLSDSRIAVLTMNTMETSYNILSLANKKLYADTHQYDLRVDFAGSGFWHKLNMVEDAIKLNRYDWIWWIDFDTLITNTTTKITDIIEETLQKHPNPAAVSMILTQDCFPLNAGSMLFRASPDVISFLNLVRECGHNIPNYSEQDCMRDLLGVSNDPNANPVVSKVWSERAVFILQHKMNAFPEEIKCIEQASRAWQRGDFVIHFAGSWAHLKEQNPVGYLMQKYRGQIVHE